MRADHRRAALECGHRCCERACQGSCGRARIADDPSERALPRDSDQHRPTQRAQLVQASQELEVLVGRLAEADPGIDADPLLGDSLLDGERDALLEEGQHIGDDVVVVRSDLHRSRLALHVHETDERVSVSDDLGHVRVAA